MTIAVTTTLSLIHFPMWGSMFFPGSDDYTEEDYYLKEWSAEEVAQVSSTCMQYTCGTGHTCVWSEQYRA